MYLLFALFFAFSAFLPILEQRGFVLQVFYENLPSFLSFLPVFLVSLYACAKGLRSIGRAADIALPVSAVCFVLLFLMAVTEGDYTALLPCSGRGRAFCAAEPSGCRGTRAARICSSFWGISATNGARRGRSCFPTPSARRPCSLPRRLLRHLFGHRPAAAERAGAHFQIRHRLYLAGKSRSVFRVCADAGAPICAVHSPAAERALRLHRPFLQNRAPRPRRQCPAAGADAGFQPILSGDPDADDAETLGRLRLFCTDFAYVALFLRRKDRALPCRQRREA